MSFNLIDLIKDQIGDQLLGQVGSVLGTDATQTSGAVSGALPGLLSGLTSSANAPGGASALFDAVQKQDDGMLGNIGNLLGGSQSNDVANQGSSLLTSLLGGGAMGQLAGVIANFAGISRGNSSSLMGMLAPIIIGVIKKKVFDGGLNASSLASMLTDQKDNINAAMPQQFSGQLQSAGFFDSIAPEAVSALGTSSTTVNEPARAPDAPSGGGLMRWLLPLVAVAVLGFFGLQYFNKEAANDAAAEAQNAATEAAEKATAASQDAIKTAQEAMPDGVDLTKITGGIEGIFGSATDTLSGITDADSATAALPALEEVGSKVSGLTDVIGRLPDAAKGPVGSVISGGISALQPIIDKVSAIPGVGALIEPILGPMMETLNGLAG